LLAAEAAEEMRKQKLQQAPINVRDELVVEINTLKEQISRCRERLASNLIYVGDQANQSSARNSYFEHARVQHESNITMLVESQRALLLVLAELAKEVAKDKPTKAWHSNLPPKPGEDGKWLWR